MNNLKKENSKRKKVTNLERISLNKDNSEQEKMKKDNSENETSEKRQFWKGII